MDKFFGGMIAGIICSTLIGLIIFDGRKTIRTNKKIKPEWQLVTDGKVIDTVYIYVEK